MLKSALRMFCVILVALAMVGCISINRSAKCSSCSAQEKCTSCESAR